MTDQKEGTLVPALYEETPATVDARPTVPTKQPSLMDELPRHIPNMGSIDITPEQRDILFAPVAESEINIRPDGMVYVPWPFYAERLNNAFGHGKWALVPDGPPKMGGSGILWGHFLVVKGIVITYAVGEQAYHPTNARMSWSDATEGAWSNALMRCCKHLGMTNELWKPGFANAWRDKHCVEVRAGGKVTWKKKGEQP